MHISDISGFTAATAKREPETPDLEAKRLDDDSESRDIKLRQKSRELEAVFMTQMMKAMEKTIPDGLFGGKSSLPTMLFSSVMGDALAGSGGIGLSEMIYQNLKEDGGETRSELNTEAYLYLLQSGGLELKVKGG